jgi:cytoskeletal protein CcmA (bactofilin family)
VQNTIRIALGVLILLGLIMLPACSLMAAEEAVVIAADETREGSTFVAGDKVRIEGTIDGDLYVAGDTVVINGSVNGDIIGFARILMISGPVQGDVRAVAQTIRFQGTVSGSATTGSEILHLEKQAAMGGDLVAGCSSANLDGLINGSLFAAAGELYLSGSVARSVNLNVGTLNVADGAAVGGNLTYVSSTEGYISPNARIDGRLLWKPEAGEAVSTAADQESPWSARGFLISLAGILIVYWLAKKFQPQLWDRLAQPAHGRLASVAGIGLLLLISTPILAILAMITVVGIPLSIIILILYGILLYVSKLVASIYLADLLKIKYNLEQPWLWFAVLVALMLAVDIPYIGWIVSVAVLALGLGCGFYTIMGNGTTKTDTPDNPA